MCVISHSNITSGWRLVDFLISDIFIGFIFSFQREIIITADIFPSKGYLANYLKNH